MGLVVEGELAQELAGGGVDDADVEVLDDQQDVGSGVGSPEADVVQPVDVLAGADWATQPVLRWPVSRRRRPFGPGCTVCVAGSVGDLAQDPPAGVTFGDRGCFALPRGSGSSAG